jgi:hypothetical protein
MRGAGYELRVADLFSNSHVSIFCCQNSKRNAYPDKPEITNYKHQITNKFQYQISKSQTKSKSNCLEF